jgi:YD repeat-containing protein
VQTFGYDANARLTSERNYKGAELTAFLGNAAAPATQATTYAYDDVGNRTGKTVTTPAGTESTAYAYDSNDRLLTETLTTATGTTVTTTYTWDGNGNLASKSSPGEYTGYIFDADNRLVEVRRGATQGTATTVASSGYDGRRWCWRVPPHRQRSTYGATRCVSRSAVPRARRPWRPQRPSSHWLGT